MEDDGQSPDVPPRDLPVLRDLEPIPVRGAADAPDGH